MIAVLSLNTFPVVIRKLANLPSSKLPTILETPNTDAGVVVSASNAFASDKPLSIAFLRLVMNVAGERRSAVVKQKGIPAFSNAAGLVGASSQCFISDTDTNLASLGSSTSMAIGKFNGTINVDLVAAISFTRWYSLPLDLMMYCTPNSSPILSARTIFHLSFASNTCGKDCVLFHAIKLKFTPSLSALFLYHFASIYV